MSTTRDGLLTAAAAAFDRDGYARATIDDVCDRAGVTKGALYGHFSSKKALALALLDRQAQEWARTRERLQRLHRSPLQVLVDLGYAVNRDRVVVQRLLFQAPICDDVADRQIARWTSAVLDLLRAADRRGELRAGLDLPACADAVVSALVGVHLMSMAVDDPEGVARQLARVWRSWLPALARPEVCATLRVEAPRRLPG
ncbi:TetR/AcrR family transcriptional regulator [Saccharothrix algeriensis]|uniref:AcrR family transcriptional regulator n=1 Tax=Saccharothrix algeriensis TaxID=173560 RepID=A0A8T8I0U8_9PSEU|nr:TetR/AcrR family transcriptional regulator [Saccharothrix algeriensis]MBM7810083.1 AcrR family transcriptional regulator [Saccharothrix algeriensis]QTR04297.1 TetR/AcrR family transcriptional regulator [Saccharothrix algeriensis]